MCGPPAPSAPPMAETPSRSSCPAIASWGRTDHSPASAGGWIASAGCSSTKGCSSGCDHLRDFVQRASPNVVDEPPHPDIARHPGVRPHLPDLVPHVLLQVAERVEVDRGNRRLV